ncbi:uncharacterized protein EI90DRAFT_3014027 [Cantharellus anzutake]|uniref:uncharacterized protein n=1 Tax=Cantharellus anzutake TaxID=1750568 RepID=UPI001907D408|nr:uncharacterized protein EI90DRAFT_3014027 [Cantharellus anzutake]KAF8337085.1 hypothetical protein EI90DRAFT_3014027 [Cantharellus anzutake]
MTTTSVTVKLATVLGIVLAVVVSSVVFAYIWIHNQLSQQRTRWPQQLLDSGDDSNDNMYIPWGHSSISRKTKGCTNDDLDSDRLRDQTDLLPFTVLHEKTWLGEVTFEEGNFFVYIEVTVPIYWVIHYLKKSKRKGGKAKNIP